MLVIASLFCGLIFGLGLLISGMVQPAKVLAFLDVFGDWDPSLAVVMIAALTVSVPGFMLAKRRERPILARQSFSPTKMGIDRRLVTGSALFGIGWGLVGFCPGPALENLATLSPRVIAFVVAMAGGMALRDYWQKRWPGPSTAISRIGTTPDWTGPMTNIAIPAIPEGIGCLILVKDRPAPFIQVNDMESGFRVENSLSCTLT